MNIRTLQKAKNYFAVFAVVLLTLSAAMPANATILFQDDNFATIDSESLIIDNNNTSAGNIILQFGQALAKTLLYSQANSRFEINSGLDLGNNQLSTARLENVASMPGGAGGLTTGDKGRIVQLTATDSTAPGCTVAPNCTPGSYSWDGTTWNPLQITPNRTILVTTSMDINTAIQSLKNSGGSGVIKLLVGTHTITSPIVVDGSNIEIVGEGPGTIVTAPSAGWTGGTAANVAAIQVGAADGTAPVTNVNIRNFTLKVEPDISGVKINGGTENNVTDMIVTSTGQKTTNTRTAIIVTDGSATTAKRITASRNIINRSDATACTGAGFCWIDGIHFDGDKAFTTQSFGYDAGGGISDSMVSSNIINDAKQSSYVFSGVSATGISSNHSRNIGITATTLGWVINNATGDRVINNSIETNNDTTTNGISIYNNVQSSTFIGNVIDKSGGSNFNIAIDLRSGTTPSNDNIISSNQINGTATGINVGSGNLRTIVNNNQFLNATTRLTDAGTSTKLETMHHESTGATNPGVSDDYTKGYNVGTVWVNTIVIPFVQTIF